MKAFNVSISDIKHDKMTAVMKTLDQVQGIDYAVKDFALSL